MTMSTVSNITKAGTDLLIVRWYCRRAVLGSRPLRRNVDQGEEIGRADVLDLPITMIPGR